MPDTTRPAPPPPCVTARRRALALGARLVAGAALALGGPIATGAAEPSGLVVIVHLDMRVSSIDEEEIRRLFLGRSRKLPNGARAELAAYGPERTFFNERVLGLSDARVAAVWSRLRFSGRTPPPQVFDSADAVVTFVASTPDAIAYVPASTPRNGVRVLYSVPR